MSRDVGLIGLLRYLPLVQFTKARPVDSLGPFSLASLETGFVMATRLPATRGSTAHTITRQRWIRVPARLSESPRHSYSHREHTHGNFKCSSANDVWILNRRFQKIRLLTRQNDTHYGGYCIFEYLRDSSSP